MQGGVGPCPPLAFAREPKALMVAPASSEQWFTLPMLRWGEWGWGSKMQGHAAYP